MQKPVGLTIFSRSDCHLHIYLTNIYLTLNYGGQSNEADCGQGDRLFQISVRFQQESLSVLTMSSSPGFLFQNCPLSAGITVRFDNAAAVRFRQESVSAFNRNLCPFSTGNAVRFRQESVSALLRNWCPVSAGICT